MHRTSQQLARRRLSLAAKVALALSIPLACGTTAHADEDAQREYQARIAYELQRLEQLAEEGSHQQEANARTRFRWDWLQRDLALIRRGIEEHPDAERQPRAVPALRGDYRP